MSFFVSAVVAAQAGTSHNHNSEAIPNARRNVAALTIDFP